MAITYPTASLFGFLATTALGAGLTFLAKSKTIKMIGTGVAAFGVLGLFGLGVEKLIDHLCCKKGESSGAEDFFDGVDPDPKTFSKNDSAYGQYLDSDSEGESVYRTGSFSEVPLIDPVPDEPEGNIQTATTTVQHNPGVLAKMLGRLSEMINSKNPAKEKEV